MHCSLTFDLQKIYGTHGTAVSVFIGVFNFYPSSGSTIGIYTGNINFGYKIRATKVPDPGQYCPFDCMDAITPGVHGTCQGVMCICQYDFIGDTCTMRSNLIENTQNLTLDLQKSEKIYFKV